MNLSEFLNRLANPAIMPFVAGGLVMVVWASLYYWQKNRATEIEAGLKRDMIERGMSADEIERVLKATAQPAEE
jgi:hypothetical protein